MLSIIVPIYNESSYIFRCLENVVGENIPECNKEIIVVDDGSTDNSCAIIRDFIKNHPDVRLYTHQKNLGKGAAIKTAMKYARGQILIIQDADLEYDPQDYHTILKIYKNKDAGVVYGSRILGSKIYHNYNASYLFFIGGLFLTKIMNFLFKLRLTDQPTGYKSWRSCYSLGLLDYCQSNGFEFEIEMTAYFSRMTTIWEVPIRYYPRSVSFGKKITLADFITSVLTAIKCRILPVNKSF